MDPETERQLAAMIMEEANRLRTEAEREGVGAYLTKPKIRARANPQFLQATVRSVQQSNRIVEVNEMWRRRNVELENERGRRSARWGRSHSSGERSDGHEDTTRDRRPGDDSDGGEIEDGVLKDEELEQFLHSRLKRGRGAVGSRMDETGPYLPAQAGKQLGSSLLPDERPKDDWEERIIGPQAGGSYNGKEIGGGWDRASWKRKERVSSDAETVKDGANTRRRRESKEKRPKSEKDSKRDSKKTRKKLEKSSKRRR